MIKKIAKILIDKNLTVATTESCTGGLLSSKFTDISGSSAFVHLNFVTYSNEAKIKRLGVRKETLDAYGAVSKETAREMAEGIAKESCSNTSIATTGIAGPGGGTNEKPVGLVYIAVHVNNNTTIEKCNFSGNREEVRVSATNHALEMLKVELENQGYK